MRFDVTVLHNLQKNLSGSFQCSRETALHRFLKSTLTISKQDLEARNMPSSTTGMMNPCKQLNFVFVCELGCVRHLLHVALHQYVPGFVVFCQSCPTAISSQSPPQHCSPCPTHCYSPDWAIPGNLHSKISLGLCAQTMYLVMPDMHMGGSQGTPTTVDLHAPVTLTRQSVG